MQMLRNITIPVTIGIVPIDIDEADRGSIPSARDNRVISFDSEMYEETAANYKGISVVISI